MFTKDSRTEIFLSQMGVDFKYTNNVAFSQLAPSWNAKNLARPVAIREEAVLEYATLMESGSAAPAPMLHHTNVGHDVLDGVQRLAACQTIGTSAFSAYLVTCDSENLLTAIRVLANARLQGRPEPPEWTKRQAVSVLVVERGLTSEEVARMGGWSINDIRKLSAALQWSFAIRCIGGPNLPDNMISAISERTTIEEIRKEPKVMARFFSLLKECKLSTDAAEPFISAFFAPIHKSSKSHEIYCERLEEVRADPEIDIRISGRRTPRQTDHALLRRALKSAETIAARIAGSCEPLPYADEFFKILNAIERHLQSSAPRHEKPRTAPTPADRWSNDE